MKRIWSALFALLFLSCACVGFTNCKKSKFVDSRYEITAEYAPAFRTLTGTVKCTIENGGEQTFSVLKFQLYPNAYRKNALYRAVSAVWESAAYYEGESYGEIVVSSVSGAKNWLVTGEDENILSVALETPLSTGDKVVLDIAFTTKLAMVNHRTGVAEHTVNLGNFYPILCAIKDGEFVENVYYSDGDPFCSSCAAYTMTLTVPKEYTVASTGEITAERVLESKKEYTMSRTNVRDFAVVLSDSFREARTAVNGKTLRYCYYADPEPQKTLQTLQETFAFYEETFGAYPYDSYTAAQVGLCFGGMEYPCLSMLSADLTGEEATRAIAHETAHQWWYGVVGSDAVENAWQDEGLAEYSATVFFERHTEYGLSRTELVSEALREYRAYYDVYGSVLGRSDTRMTRHLKEYLSEYEYKCLAVDKAVVMFDSLRKSIGDKKFFGGLKRYFRSCAYAVASPSDLVACFERDGADVKGFFDSFLQGKAIL